MSALFSRWSDTKLRVGLGSLLVILLGVPTLLMIWVRTPQQNFVGQLREQPVQFDHRHHVRDDGIDCLYCHYHATHADTAGMPETQLCMGCHVQIWPDSPLLESVHLSWATDRPLPWRRIHDLPEFTYFNHAIHVQKGIGCESCHGRVDLMANVYKVAPLTMGWCLNCHRQPERYLRPPELVTTMGYQPPIPQRQLGEQLKRELDVHAPTHCTACHR